MTSMAAYRVKGTTDDVTTCDQCGREDLRMTVVMAPLDPEGNEDGEVYMGTCCAAKAAGWTQATVRKLATAADKAAKQAAWEADRRRADAEQAAFMAGYLPWLEATHGSRDEAAVVSRLRRSPEGRQASPFQLRKAYRQTRAA